jgi:hypothetical protein
MRLTLSFIFVAIALLQVTTAYPVVGEVEKRDIKKFAYLVAADPPVAGGETEVEKRDIKKFAYLVAKDSSDDNVRVKNPHPVGGYFVAEESRDVEGVVEA